LGGVVVVPVAAAAAAVANVVEFVMVLTWLLLLQCLSSDCLCCYGCSAVAPAGVVCVWLLLLLHCCDVPLGWSWSVLVAAAWLLFAGIRLLWPPLLLLLQSELIVVGRQCATAVVVVWLPLLWWLRLLLLQLCLCWYHLHFLVNAVRLRGQPQVMNDVCRGQLACCGEFY